MKNENISTDLCCWIIAGLLSYGVVMGGEEKEVNPQEKAAAEPEIVATPDEPEGIEKQWLDFYRTSVRKELYLIRKVCDASVEDLRKINVLVEKKIRQLAKTKVRAERQNEQPGVLLNQVLLNAIGVRNVRAKPAVNPVPKLSVESALHQAAQEVLTPEQWRLYQAEGERRQLFRKRAGVNRVIVRLDSNLGLSSTQRQQLQEKLIAGWDEAWCPTPEVAGVYFSDRQNVVPPVPPQLIEPILTESQRKIWKSLGKNKDQIELEHVQMQLHQSMQNQLVLTEEDLGLTVVDTTASQEEKPLPVEEKQ